ncbi:hypothetical protein OSTOST_13924 [Ostertagia ostertagi]
MYSTEGGMNIEDVAHNTPDKIFKEWVHPSAADNKIVAVDCKMNLDDNALMRHADLASLRDTSEEDPTEVEAGKYNPQLCKTGW